jgi:hypothetical protein
LKTQKFEVEIADVTGKFPVDARRMEFLLERKTPDTHKVRVVDVTWGD